MLQPNTEIEPFHHKNENRFAWSLLSQNQTHTSVKTHLLTSHFCHSYPFMFCPILRFFPSSSSLLCCSCKPEVSRSTLCVAPQLCLPPSCSRVYSRKKVSVKQGSKLLLLLYRRKLTFITHSLSHGINDSSWNQA